MSAPAWVASLLESRWLAALATAGLLIPFLWSGITKLVDFDAAVAETRGLGLEPATPLAALTIAVQLGGSALVFVPGLAWLGAGMLAVFTLLATLKAHAFWTAPAGAKPRQEAAFAEHLGLIGGLALAAVVGQRIWMAP